MTMTTPNNTLSREIAESLRSEILRGSYKEGARLPSERDLATTFTASRGAVREALSELAQSGLIDIQPGGVRVQALENASLSVLGPLMALDSVPSPQLVEQFLQIFGMLSSLTAKNAVEKANDEQLQELQRLLDVLAQHPRDFESMEPHWRDILEYMAEIDNNLVIRLIGNDLRSQFLGEQMQQQGIKPELDLIAGTEFINTLQLALSERDGFMAAEAVRKHFDQIQQAFVLAVNIAREVGARTESSFTEQDRTAVMA